MRKYSFYIIILTISILLSSCETKNKTEDSNLIPENDLIEVSSAQFVKAKMELGKPENHLFSEIVTTKGYLKSSSDGKANVSVFLPGKVKGIRFVVGDYVSKGDKLFELEGSEIIELQQNFVQNKAELEMAEYEFSRLEKLSEEKIAAKKDFQLAKRNLLFLKAENEGLKARLDLLGINSKKVEANEFSSKIPILAPISGYVSQLNIVQGEFLEPQKLAVEIVDTRNLKLYLSVFETDILNLEEGQKVLFFDSDRKYRKFQGVLSVVGKSIDPVSKTIQCIADIDNAGEQKFVNGMYVECAVVTSDYEAKAIPTDAIIKDGYNNYVLVKEREENGVIGFSKVKIDVGIEELEFTEVLTEGLQDVLLAGVYNLNVEE